MRVVVPFNLSLFFGLLSFKMSCWICWVQSKWMQKANPPTYHLIKQNLFLNSISKNDFFTNHKRVLLKFKRKYTNLTKTFLPISFIRKSIAQSTLDEYRGRTSRIALALYTLKHPGEHNTDPYIWLAA